MRQWIGAWLLRWIELRARDARTNQTWARMGGMRHAIDAPSPTLLEQLQAETRRATAAIPPGRTTAIVTSVEWTAGTPAFRFGAATKIGDHFQLSADALTQFSKASTTARLHVAWSF